VADITGPIHTLPGAGHAVPEGTMCDDHPDRPATHRVQGETDSMGSELYDMCDDCFKEYKAHGVYTPDDCDWCKKTATDIRPTRDYEEGMCGPVYYVCGACRKRRDERAEQEMRDSGYDDDCWDDFDDDTYEAERTEIIDVDDWPPPPSKKVTVSCKGCGKSWKPGHECRATRVRELVRRSA
jgi:hypothetical protein